MAWPKHGELRGSDRYDRVSMAWVRADEWQARQWEREDRAFARRTNQGEIACPQIVKTDGQGGINGLQSMVDGKYYDSKSAMRRHYRERGVTEVGNDRSVTEPGPIKRWRDPNHDKKVEAAVGRALEAVSNTMSDETVRLRAQARQAGAL